MWPAGLGPVSPGADGPAAVRPSVAGPTPTALGLGALGAGAADLGAVRPGVGAVSPGASRPAGHGAGQMVQADDALMCSPKRGPTGAPLADMHRLQSPRSRNNNVPNFVIDTSDAVPDDGQNQQGEQELATKMLQIQSKRFYLDVKQNRRGRFIKVAEIGADGRRSQIFLALSTAADFRDHLSSFSDFYASLGPPNPESMPEDGKLKSEMMIKENRRYYLDLKENSRGRFLRVSQTITRGGPRSQIAIPAQGMIEFRDALTDLLDEFGTDDGGFKGELPEGRHMRVENKNFYFDIGQNNRGIYMRISEVKSNFRTAITVPEKSWARFRDIFADYCDKMKDGNTSGGASASGSLGISDKASSSGTEGGPGTGPGPK